MNESAGWDAIEKEFQRVYPGQDSPRHFAPMIKWIFGGNDPLDGISIYDAGDCWHFVTFGLTEIYEKETDDPEISGYGYEMTFKLKKDASADGEDELKNVCGILQAIARITFNSGEVFGPYEFLHTGQTTGIDLRGTSAITGFICVPDPSVQALDTPNGKMTFLELVGVTDPELKTLSTRDSVKALYEKLGSDVTDYRRASLV